MQTVCESGCLNLYPIADDESYSKGTIAFTFAQKEQLAPPREIRSPGACPRGQSVENQIADDARDPHVYGTSWNSGGTKLLWVPRLGAPTVTQQPDLTILETDT